MSYAFRTLGWCWSLLCIVSSFSAAHATTLSVFGPTNSASFSASAGDSFGVSVYANSYSDLYAWQFDLRWNPSILVLASIAEGPALSAVGTTFFVPGSIDNVAGVATANADTLIGAIPGASGASQALAYFDFTALTAGTTAITLSSINLLDSNLGDLPTDAAAATASVTGPSVSSVPEPVISVLWVLGGIVMAIGKRVARNLS